MPEERTGDVPAALRDLVEVCADGLALVGADGRVTAVNEPARRLLGDGPGDPAGRASPFGVRDDDRSGARRTVRHRTPDGGVRDLEYRVLPRAGGGHAVWFRDVTEDRRRQERLTAIARAASGAAGAGSLESTLDAVAQEIVQTANIAAVQILAVHDPAADLRILGMAGFGVAPDFVERLSACRARGAHVRFLDSFRLGKTIVVRHRKASIMADPAWAPLHEIMDRPDWDGFVSVPMAVRGTTLGVINAYYEPGEDPGSGSLAFLEAMADQAAVAVDTAGLVAQSRSEARSAERRRLARDLHDSVVQQLFSMRMQATALRARLDEPGAEITHLRSAVSELADLSSGALGDLRLLVRELRPAGAERPDLVEAVRAHAASVQARTGLVVDVQGAPELPADEPDMVEDLYRIVCEAVHNVVKHAAATTVRVVLLVDGPDLMLEVIDDGAGGAGPEPASSGERFGMVSMRERAQRWAGRFSAGARPGGGWAVRVVVPLRRTAAEPVR